MKVDLDYLRIRTQADVCEVRDSVDALWLDLPRVREPTQPREGFKFADNLVEPTSGTVLATTMWGGDSQRGWVHVILTGKGCEWLQCFSGWEERWGRHMETLPKYSIRRVDLALTTWHGEVSHEQVVAAHAAGHFETTCPVAMQTIVSTDPTAGRTCYVGKRTSGKMLRAYERGLKLAKDARPVELTHIGGSPVEDVYRVEIEFKATDRDLPASMVHQRDAYFAGAYPFCRYLLPTITPRATRLNPFEAVDLDVARSLENIKVQYGVALQAALDHFEGDITAVWDLIVSQRPRRVIS